MKKILFILLFLPLLAYGTDPLSWGVKGGGGSTDTTSLSNRIDSKADTSLIITGQEALDSLSANIGRTSYGYNEEIQMLSYLGSGIKLSPAYFYPNNAWTDLTDGRGSGNIYWCKGSLTVDSVLFALGEDGVFVGDNYNGFVLYRVNSDLSMTEVARTDNDETIFKGDDYSVHIVPFVSSANLTKGAYFLMWNWNTSDALPTAIPEIAYGDFPSILNNFDLGSSFKVAGYVGYATMPSSLNMSDLTASTRIWAMFLK